MQVGAQKDETCSFCLKERDVMNEWMNFWEQLQTAPLTKLNESITIFKHNA